jgi:O-antigen/teichoic acid export membrane protein
MVKEVNGRRLIENSIALFVKLFFTLFISLYSSRIVLEQLGVVDYGIYNVVGGVVLLLNFLTGAMSSSTNRYFSFHLGANDGELSKIYSVTILIYSLLTIIVLLSSQTIGLWFLENKLNIPEQRLDAAFWVYQITVGTLILSIAVAPFDALLMANEKMKVFSVIGVFTMIVRFILVLTLINVNFDKLIYYSVILFGLSILTFTITYVTCIKTKIKPQYSYIADKDLFVKLTSYTGWNLFGNLAAIGFNQGINILLNIFFGPTVNAARAISFQVNSALISFTGNISAALSPQIIKRYSSSEFESMLDLTYKGSRYSFYVLLIMSMPIFVNTEKVIQFWLGTVPEFTVVFIKLVIVDSLICSLSGTIMASIQATGRIKYYQMVVGGILLLNIPMSYILLTIHKDPVIPFLVTVVLSLVAVQARIFFMKTLLQTRYFDFYKKVLIRVISVTVMCSLSLFFLFYYFEIIYGNFILSSLITIIVTVAIIYILGLESDEKKFLNKNIKKYMYNVSK